MQPTCRFCQHYIVFRRSQNLGSGWIHASGPMVNSEFCNNLTTEHVAQPADLEPADSQRKRLSRPRLFMKVAKLYGERSSCPRANVGAVAVRDGRIIAAGYCGAPSGQAHCQDVGCLVVDGHCQRSVHAESNLIAWAARTGTSLMGTAVYCTHGSCLRCAQLLLNAGISIFTYEALYTDNNEGLNLLVQGDVIVRNLDATAP